jgi:hypothetical protein
VGSDGLDRAGRECRALIPAREGGGGLGRWKSPNESMFLGPVTMGMAMREKGGRFFTQTRVWNEVRG